ncbi:MAG: hypothetical protein JW829_00830 [Pirellulales bacterium]|nr:hypothetical protein [Pirellulales bacterium]
MTPLFDNLLIDGVPPLPPPPIVHIGDNDPIGESWVLSTNGAIANNGPVDDGGVPAWNMEDAGSTRAAWTRWISYDQIAEANSKGWKLHGRVRVLGTDDVPDGGIELSVFPDSQVGYTLWLGSDAAGNAIVAEYGGVQASGLALGRSITLDSGGYHDYEIVFDPTSQTTDILVDGNLAIEDMLSTQLTSTVLNRILWGANSSAGQGNANYSFVEFHIIPEPTSIVLGLVVLAFATLVVRQRSVSSL